MEEKDLALLLFVLKVMQNSNGIDQSDVDHLRNLAWNDTEILEATYHGATQTGVDKIFNAFKIESEM